MSKRNIHVVPNKESGNWQVKKEGNPNPLSKHKTQANAEKAGRAIAKKSEVELVIHRRVPSV